jgi:hypothetical protein
MIANLQKVPSRYIYPALAGKIPGIAADMIKTLDTYAAKINQKLKVR